MDAAFHMHAAHKNGSCAFAGMHGRLSSHCFSWGLAAQRWLIDKPCPQGTEEHFNS